MPDTDKREIFSFSNFGYEGAIIKVETDLRNGIPAYDIVGLSDGEVKAARERVMAAFKNSEVDYPKERILQSLSPADIKKEGASFDLAMALGILNEQANYKGDNVLVMGELELSGNVRPVKAVKQLDTLTENYNELVENYNTLKEQINTKSFPQIRNSNTFER